VRLGGAAASTFFDDVLPDLLAKNVLVETQWRGKGVQRRFRLVLPMSEVNEALERSAGDFDTFLTQVSAGQK
jgi:hypothetical protein